jgi:hypothetical protein
VTRDVFVPVVVPVMSGASQWRSVVREVLLAGTSESIIINTALPVADIWLGEEMLGAERTSVVHSLVDIDLIRKYEACLLVEAVGHWRRLWNRR